MPRPQNAFHSSSVSTAWNCQVIIHVTSLHAELYATSAYRSYSVSPWKLGFGWFCRGAKTLPHKTHISMPAPVIFGRSTDLKTCGIKTIDAACFSYPTPSNTRFTSSPYFRFVLVRVTHFIIGISLNRVLVVSIRVIIQYCTRDSHPPIG